MHSRMIAAVYDGSTIHDDGPSYTAAIIRKCISKVLGDYRYVSVEISPVPSDGDVRFQPMAHWLQELGLRYYITQHNTNTYTNSNTNTNTTWKYSTF